MVSVFSDIPQYCIQWSGSKLMLQEHGSDEFTLAAVAMAFRMVQYWNHG